MLKAQYKLVIALVPFLAAGAFASVATYPSYVNAQAKRAEVEGKKEQNETLLAKLRGRTRAESDRHNLQAEVQTLRGAVPKQPELDLFMMDLEKMCHDCDVDLVAVESPDNEALKAIGNDQDVAALKETTTTAGKLSIGSKTLEKSLPQAGAKPGAKPGAEKTADDTGLKQLVKQVYVTGDFEHIVALMRKLESYQRVTGVRQLSVAMPAEGAERITNSASDRAKKLGLKQPVASFLMSLYYLP